MGLSVVAYWGLRRVDAEFEDGVPIDPVSREDLEDCLVMEDAPGFAGRCAPYTVGAVYAYAGKLCGYQRAYSGHSHFRETLAQLVGYPKGGRGTAYAEHYPHQAGACEAQSGPFHELIVFSDCEGVIGLDAIKKLAADFAEWDAAASAVHDEQFYEQYGLLRRQVDVAADGGCLYFS